MKNLIKDEYALFGNATTEIPENSIAILWLSPEMFTEPALANEEFHAAFPDPSIMSVTEIIEKYFFVADRTPAHVQRTKIDKEGNETYRPYVVFYNEPAKCFFAVQLTSKDCPNNPSFVKMDTEFYKYIHTNLQRISYTTVCVSRAFPISRNMTLFKLYEKLNKFEPSFGMSNFLNTTFIENETYKANSLKPMSQYFATPNNQKTSSTSAMMGFYMLNFLHTMDYVDREIAKHTTTSSIPHLVETRENIQRLNRATVALASMMMNYLKTKDEIEQYKDEFDTIRDKFEQNKGAISQEELKRASEIMSHNKKTYAGFKKICVDISDTLKIIYRILDNLSVKNISNFDFDLIFANDFISTACNSKTNNIPTIKQLYANNLASVQTLSNYIEKLQKQKQEEEKEAARLKRQKELAKKAEAEEAKRKAQSEKDKIRHQNNLFKTAQVNLQEISGYNRFPEYNISSFLANCQTIEQTRKQISDRFAAYSTPSDNPIFDAANKKILELLPSLKDEVDFHIGALNECERLAKSVDLNVFSSIAGLIKERTVPREVIMDDPQLLKFLNSSDEILTTFDTVVSPINHQVLTFEMFAKEMFPNQNLLAENMAQVNAQYELLKQNIDEIRELLDSLNLKDDPSKIVPVANCNSYIESINNAQTIAEMVEISKAGVDIIGNNIKKLNSTKARLEHIKTLCEERTKYANWVERLKEDSDETLLTYLGVCYGKEKNCMLRKYGVFGENANYKEEFSIEHTIWRDIISMAPMEIPYNINVSNIYEFCDKFASEIERQTEFYKKVVFFPKACADVITTLTSGLVAQNTFLNNFYSSKILNSTLMANFITNADRTNSELMQRAGKIYTASRIDTILNGTYEHIQIDKVERPKSDDPQIERWLEKLPLMFQTKPDGRCISVFDLISDVALEDIIALLTETKLGECSTEKYLNEACEYEDSPEECIEKINGVYKIYEQIVKCSKLISQNIKDMQYVVPEITNKIKENNAFQTNIFSIISDSLEEKQAFQTCLIWAYLVDFHHRKATNQLAQDEEKTISRLIKLRKVEDIDKSSFCRAYISREASRINAKSRINPLHSKNGALEIKDPRINNFLEAMKKNNPNDNPNSSNGSSTAHTTPNNNENNGENDGDNSDDGQK